MAPRFLRPHSRDDFKIAIVCALPLEADLVYKVFDKSWTREGVDFGKAGGDQNAYTLGVIGKHNVVLVHMSGTGTVPAAAVSAGIGSTFTQIEIAFVVGICGASPIHPETQQQINLGDCILSTTVIEYDFGKQYDNQFVRKSEIEEVHGRANPTIRSLLNQFKVPGIRQDLAKNLDRHLQSLQATTIQAVFPEAQTGKPVKEVRLEDAHDRAFSEPDNSQTTIPYGSIDHSATMSGAAVRQSSLDGTAGSGPRGPQIHLGRIGFANTVVKSHSHRDRLSTMDKIVGFEMEGAGIWDNLPAIILKSVCDYADEDKSDFWQPYAAATAAAGLKAVLEYWSTPDDKRIRAQVQLNIPDYAVSHFVQRVNIQNELNEWLFDDLQEKRMVLLGMGGAGKSQLALSCCRMAVESGSFRTVLWFDASSIHLAEQSLKIILSELDESVSLNMEENLDILARVLRSRPSSWLAVFDNLDTSDASGQSLVADFIPKAERGKILFTSRHTDWEKLGRVIRVSGMSDEESLQLLLKRPVHDEAEQAIGLKIATQLGHLALALDQAHAYTRAQETLLQNFLKHFKHRRKKTLEEIPHDRLYKRSATGDEQDILSSTYTTFELSMEQICGDTQMKQNKTHFLTLCAFFEPCSFSKDYFQSYCKSRSTGWTTILKNETVWDETSFDILVDEFRELSFLQHAYSYPQTSISLHPLVRDWLKARMANEERKAIACEFIDMLLSHTDTVDFNVISLVKQQQLILDIVLGIQQDQDALHHLDMALADSDGVFGGILRTSGLYQEAVKLHKQALAGNEQQLESEQLRPEHLHKSMASKISIPAHSKYDDSEKRYKQALAHRLEQLGPTHRYTLRTMHNLAVIYLYKSRYDDAEKLYKQALVGRRKLLGSGHRYTTQTMEGLANVYEYKGRYNEAEKLYKQILAIRHDQLEPRDPCRLRIMHSLASVYQGKSKYNKAEKLYKQLLLDNKERFGPKHHETNRTMHNLAVVYMSSGRHYEAEKLFKQVLPAYQETLGASNWHTLLLEQNLATVCYRSDYRSVLRYDEAEALFEHSLAGLREELGPEHVYTLSSMVGLALVYHKKGRYDEAEELLKEVLACRKELLGAEHPEVLRTTRNLAVVDRDRIAKSIQGSNTLQHCGTTVTPKNKVHNKDKARSGLFEKMFRRN